MASSLGSNDRDTDTKHRLRSTVLQSIENESPRQGQQLLEQSRTKAPNPRGKMRVVDVYSSDDDSDVTIHSDDEAESEQKQRSETEGILASNANVPDHGVAGNIEDHSEAQSLQGLANANAPGAVADSIEDQSKDQSIQDASIIGSMMNEMIDKLPNDVNSPDEIKPGCSSSNTAESNTTPVKNSGRLAGRRKKVPVTPAFGCSKKRKRPEKKSSDSDQEENYTVEKILKTRIGDEGKPEFYIKWKGWPYESCTWEPVEHLDNCPQLLEKFQKARAAKKDKPINRRRRASDKAQPDSDANSQLQLQLIDFGILKEWPAERVPLGVLGVQMVDDRLIYVIRCQTNAPNTSQDQETDSFTSENVVVVPSCPSLIDACHEMIIEYYQERLEIESLEKDNEEGVDVAAATYRQAKESSPINL